MLVDHSKPCTSHMLRGTAQRAAAAPPSQVDRQAEDRAHRLGQKRPVKVYRLVTKGTVDQGIHATAERKLKLDAAVLGGVTVSTAGQGGKAKDSMHMAEILADLLVQES